MHSLFRNQCSSIKADYNKFLLFQTNYNLAGVIIGYEGNCCKFLCESTYSAHILMGQKSRRFKHNPELLVHAELCQDKPFTRFLHEQQKAWNSNF